MKSEYTDPEITISLSKIALVQLVRDLSKREASLSPEMFGILEKFRSALYAFASIADLENLEMFEKKLKGQL